MKTRPTLPLDYRDLLVALKARIGAARLRAATSVNRELVLLYWEIGSDILARQSAEGWGTGVIDRLAHDLRRDFPDMTGLSPRNLKYMRAFAEAWPDREFVQQLVAHLPWGHNLRLIEGIKAPDQRVWYARQAIEQGWSRAVLWHQIDVHLFDRAGKAATNFQRTLPSPQSELARELLKDPYNFDFLAGAAALSERALEHGLIDNVRALLLELGKGFAFVGSQYHLEVGEQDFYIDLLFYHLRLRCFVVIDLKVDEFKPEYAGKMNFYLSAVDDLLRHPSDAPTIGLILCKGRNEVIVEYALRDTTKPMGVAGYQSLTQLPAALKAELPTPDDLVRELPLMSLIRLRLDVEGALRDAALRLGIVDPPVGIGPLLRCLQDAAVLPDSAAALAGALQVLNAAVHGTSISPEAAEAALESGAKLLADLRTVQAPE